MTSRGVLVGGHPGLYRSTDNGTTFTKVSGAAAVSDAHALGGSDSTIYVASPQVGLMASIDGGQSWQVRNRQAGCSFMGTILVDPADPERLIAPDRSQGLVISTDGGHTWNSLRVPAAAMAVAWNPTDTRQIIAAGRNDSVCSNDGGGSWQQIDMPSGASAVAFDTTGRTVYAGVLDGGRARIHRSTDGGITWTSTS